MKKLLFMLAVVCLVFFACGTKDGDSTANVSDRNDSVAFTKANELAGTAKKELELGGSKDKALKLFNEALGIKEIPWVLGDRGKLKIDMNDIEGAIVDLTKAIDAEKRGIYYIWRADAYRKLGNDNLANADIEEAGKLPKDY